MSPRIFLLTSLSILALATTSEAARLPSRTPNFQVPTLGSPRLPALPQRGSVDRSSASGPSSRGAGVFSAPDETGGLYYAWVEFLRDGSADIYLLRVRNDGTPAVGWPAGGVTVCRAPGDQFPVVMVPDSMGGVIVAWYDDRDAYQKPDIYAQRVNAAGVVQWAANGVRVLDSDAFPNSLSGAPDETGGLLLAWSQGLTDPNIYAIRVTSSGGIAAGWDSGGELVCADPASQDMPVVTADGLGGAYIAWLDNRDITGNSEVFVQRVSTAGNPMWTPNGIRLDLGPTNKYLVGITPVFGDAMVFWSTGDSIQAQRIDDTGAHAWSDGGVMVASPTVSASSEMVCAPDGFGGALVAWLSYPIGGPLYQAQRINGNGAPQWAAAGVPMMTNLGGVGPSGLQIAIDGTGGGYFVWMDELNGDDFDIFGQHVGPTGTRLWTVDGIAISAERDHQLEPHVGPDGAGGATVVYIDKRGLNNSIQTQRIDAAGNLLLPGGGIETWRDPGTQAPPMVLHLAGGNVMVAWSEYRSGSWDVRSRILDADGIEKTPAFTLNEELAAGEQQPVALIDDGAGGGIVVWTSEVGDHDVMLYAQRLNSGGVAQWHDNGVPLISTPGLVDPPVVTGDGAGGVIVSWADHRQNFAEADLYAQHVSPAGNALWGNDGLNVCGVTGDLTSPVITSDGGGGAILAWLDYRASQPQIYGQSLDGAGAAQWTTNGKLLADYTGGITTAFPVGIAPAPLGGAVILVQQQTLNLITFEFWDKLHALRINSLGLPQWGAQGFTVLDASSLVLSPHIVDDGAGGVYVAWSDTRGLGLDIYGQHIDNTGTGLWPANGRDLCNAASYQTLTGITRAGSDLALTWTDFRGFDCDVYAHRVAGADGADVWAANGVPVAVAVRGQFAPSIAQWHADSPDRFYIGWCDNRLAIDRQAYVQRLDGAGVPQWAIDGVTDVTVALIHADVRDGAVQLVWSTGSGASATVYRRAEGDALWSVLGRASADGSGRISFEDRDVAAGTRYGYRLGVTADGGETFSAEAWVDVPAAQLALNRIAVAGGRADIGFTLPHRGSASLDWIDVAGRRVGGRELEGLSAGAHTVDLASPRGAGVYFLRLSQAGQNAVRRVALVH